MNEFEKVITSSELTHMIDAANGAITDVMDIESRIEEVENEINTSIEDLKDDIEENYASKKDLITTNVKFQSSLLFIKKRVNNARKIQIER